MNASNELPEYVYTLERIPDEATGYHTGQVCLVRWPVERVNRENYAVVIPAGVPEQCWFENKKRAGRRLHLRKGDAYHRGATESLKEAEVAWLSLAAALYPLGKGFAGGPLIRHAFGGVDPRLEAEYAETGVNGSAGNGGGKARTARQPAIAGPGKPGP